MTKCLVHVYTTLADSETSGLEGGFSPINELPKVLALWETDLPV